MGAVYAYGCPIVKWGTTTIDGVTSFEIGINCRRIKNDKGCWNPFVIGSSSVDYTGSFSTTNINQLGPIFTSPDTKTSFNVEFGTSGSNDGTAAPTVSITIGGVLVSSGSLGTTGVEVVDGKVSFEYAGGTFAFSVGGS